jgi:hypothetical protein
MLDNPDVGIFARRFLADTMKELAERFQTAYDRALKRIPQSSFVHEIVSLRLDAHRLKDSLRSAQESLAGCELSLPESPAQNILAVDESVSARLSILLIELEERIAKFAGLSGDDPRLRHLLGQARRIRQLVGGGVTARENIEEIARVLEISDKKVRERFKGRYIMKSQDAGFALWELIGWKAANLAELEHLGRSELTPEWFVVTDHAFRAVLEMPVGNAVAVTSESTIPLRQAISEILDRQDLNYAEKSNRIKALWETVALPQDLVQGVELAYRELAGSITVDSEATDATDLGSEMNGVYGEAHSSPFVAIRSSSREEDAEAAARAGEFDTFLYVRGVESLLKHLRLTWAGLWTERAIHNRRVFGIDSENAGGGVIVQRIIQSRVSGVLLTVNVAGGEHEEFIINAGLGLGEGVVSGVVAADQITVAKEGDLEKGPLRFSYITSDKREQVVFDERRGYGTVLKETLYHQRLRPALEYVDLSKLVSIASRLEKAYGHPLDIEFGIEGDRLWILQARPVATFVSVLRDTMTLYPFRNADESNGNS